MWVESQHFKWNFKEIKTEKVPSKHLNRGQIVYGRFRTSFLNNFQEPVYFNQEKLLFSYGVKMKLIAFQLIKSRLKSFH